MQGTPRGNRGACFECGSPDHFRNACPRWVGQQVQVAVHPNQLQIVGPNHNRGQQQQQRQPQRGGAFAINAAEARNEPNVVAGTFLLNGQYATVLFDSGADYSLISSKFIPYLDISLSPLSFIFEIETVNGELSRINQVVRDCTLVLNEHPFLIDLIPYDIGSFDVIVGMNWMRAIGAIIE